MHVCLNVAERVPRVLFVSGCLGVVHPRSLMFEAQMTLIATQPH